jgi:hypothetical protein
MLGRDDAKHLACFFIIILFFFIQLHLIYIMRR